MVFALFRAQRCRNKEIKEHSESETESNESTTTVSMVVVVVVRNQMQNMPQLWLYISPTRSPPLYLSLCFSGFLVFHPPPTSSSEHLSMTLQLLHIDFYLQ